MSDDYIIHLSHWLKQREGRKLEIKSSITGESVMITIEREPDPSFVVYGHGLDTALIQAWKEIQE